MISVLPFKGSYNIKNKNEIKSQEKKTTCDEQAKPFDLNESLNGYYSRIEIKRVEPVSSDILKHTINNYKGCLLGGAIGDALGWPVEFSSLYSILYEYGEDGIVDLQKNNNKAEITDDTQMTIFTADGLLKSAIKNFNQDKMPDMSIIYNSYQNWLRTQDYRYAKNSNGWIANIPELYARRAPGTTCTGSLEGQIPGSIENPINFSRGCGGVMRVAPVGLMYYKNPKIAFEVGARCAALTHGSPSAYLPAGVHSCIIANIIQGKNIGEAIDNSIEILKTYQGNEDTLTLIEKAKKMAYSSIDPRKAIKKLGEGWYGDEAIAIALYCVLKSPEDFEKALIMAVNHDGDSDSTGAIVGNILGAYLGVDKIPAKWRNSVELAPNIEQLAKDLYAKPKEIKNAQERYPIF